LHFHYCCCRHCHFIYIFTIVVVFVIIVVGVKTPACTTLWRMHGVARAVGRHPSRVRRNTPQVKNNPCDSQYKATVGVDLIPGGTCMRQPRNPEYKLA